MENISFDLINRMMGAFDNPSHLQLFKTRIIEGDIEESIRRHKIEILLSVIYGKYTEVYLSNIREPLYCQSGFIQREGREPVDSNEILILRGKYYFTIEGNYIYSEVGFDIKK